MIVFIAPKDANEKDKARADLVLKGDDDVAKINSFIDSLSGEIEICFLGGNVDCNSTITLKNNISISGQQTVFCRKWSNAGDTSGAIFYASNAERISIRKIHIFCERNLYPAAANHGILFVGVKNSYIEKNVITNQPSCAVMFTKCENIFVNKNILTGSYVGLQSNNTTSLIATENICKKNYNGAVVNYGGGNLFNANTISNNDNCGIYLASSSDNAITSNICKDNAVNAIFLEKQADRNNINGNVCLKGEGKKSDYSIKANTIYLYSSKDNLICANLISGKDCLEEKGLNNTFSSNKV